jgi:hypothetical protein
MTARNPTIKYDRMLAWMQEILAEYADPITVRQLYYQLVARQLIGNNKNYYQKVSRDITTAREDGDINPNKIEDRGREASEGDYWRDANANEYIESVKRSIANAGWNYEYPKWVGQPNYVEVWCEKQALERIVSDIASKYGVVSCIGKGFSSFTLVNDAAKRFRSKSENHTCKILYFGDFDPSGEDMARDLLDRINRYGAPKVVVEKIALTRKQVIDNNLPFDATKPGDTRTEKFVEKNGDMCVELDSLPPNMLRSLIDTSINSCIHPDLWKSNISYHEAEREKIHAWCNSLEGAS